MKKYATIKYLKEIEVSELDLANTQKVLGKNIYDSEDGHEFIYLHLNKDHGYEGESEQISIDTLEKIIARMKKAGANYMEIVPHGDHNGYVFYGLDIKKSTADEISKFEKYQEMKSELRKRHAEINDELKEIYSKLRR